MLTLKGLDRNILSELLDEAQEFVSAPGSDTKGSNSLAGRTVANLFFEPSTRTRASFDLAGKRLGADVLNLDVNTSSRKKGESILDTIYTLQAMHVDVMVVRDASAGVPAYIAQHVDDHVSILECGRVRCFAPDPGSARLADDSPAARQPRGADGHDRRGHCALARRAFSYRA